MKFTKKDIRNLLKSDLNMDKQIIEFITSGIKHCIDNDVTHVDIVMTKVYKHLEYSSGSCANTIKRKIIEAVRKLDEAAIYTIFGFTGKLTNKRLFMLLLERYNH